MSFRIFHVFQHGAMLARAGGLKICQPRRKGARYAQ